ncbi:Trichothecene efflux pump TRI12 [Colletotrichum sidae]|uniref:Trichothecene efflux pump TRI12 n=3 Tax=Colletotrichum orbiculare species complex TaxID=2707354 RepID=N4VEX8_COLOR|nr:Trichothecene efflux pump TRI12 [Colletotrichum orbiculare MAFF 240422]TDZ35721.1 Trichothecene efflux pump TRI12 [Colletotrichum spinosum]TEA19240.1 Trichothecene efflux pump TRI12 [Colletotrichum sidae]
MSYYNESSRMGRDRETKIRMAQQAQAVIAFEDDPHRAALEDNPDEARVSIKTWIAIFSMAFSFGPPVGLAFLATASIVVPVTQELGGQDSLAWVVGSWSLSTACSFSLAGPLSDVFGRRMLVLGGQLTVAIGMIVAASAKNISSLIAAETLIGLGTGFVFVSYAGVPEMLPNKWRSLGLGILESGIAVPWGILSVLLGNALYKYASWRWIFNLGIIIEFIALLGTFFSYHPTARPRGDFDKSRFQQLRDVDWLGLLLFTAGLATALIGLTWGGTPDYPWNSVGAIAPIVVGVLVLALGFVYDFKFAARPMFPLKLFVMFRQYSVLLVVLFVSGMNFHAMSALLPQGSLYMFTTDGIEIGVLSLPNTLMIGFTGVLAPLIAHKVGYIKWQLVIGMAFQAVFIGAAAGTVYPNEKLAYAFVPAIGVPMFVWVTILSYAIASLHVPHSKLGVAMGLLGTFRSGGGAVGNAIFNTIFQEKFREFAGEEVAFAAVGNGLNPADLGVIIPSAIEYNMGNPRALLNVPGITPDIQEALRQAVRDGAGHAFKIVFLVTIPFSILALVCSLFVEDPSAYMTNHIQSAMGQDHAVDTRGRGKTSIDDGQAIEFETVRTIHVNAYAKR